MSSTLLAATNHAEPTDLLPPRIPSPESPFASGVSPVPTSQLAPPVAGDLHPKLPPAGRDFDVFYRVVIEGRPTREAAWAFKISRTRVCQLVKRVREWLWHVLPESANQPASERMLQMAKHLAADRLDHLYQEAMHAWQHSGLVERQTTRKVGTAPMTTIYQTSGRDPKFLTTAGRLAMAQARLGLPEGILMNAQALIPDDGELEKHPDLDDEPEMIEPETLDVATSSANHPPEDCSKSAAFVTASQQQLAECENVNNDQITACGAKSAEHSTAAEQSRSPVQPRDVQPDPHPVTHIELSPSTPGLTMNDLLGQIKERERLEILNRQPPTQIAEAKH